MTDTKLRQPPLIRRAGSDGIGHYHRKRATRTFCSLPVIAERLAWPTERTCLICQELLREGA